MSTRNTLRDSHKLMIPIRVLGDRVLVKPDVNDNAPVTTEAGIVLAPSLASAVTGSDPTLSVSRGTVVGVGMPRHPLKEEAEALADKLSARIAVASDPESDAVCMLRDLVRRQPIVSVGDDVLFSHDAGQAIRVDHEDYIILREDELLAVVDPG